MGFEGLFFCVLGYHDVLSVLEVAQEFSWRLTDASSNIARGILPRCRILPARSV